jgi:phage terminase small subunit
MPRKGITDKGIRFAHEYVKDFNGAAAARRAGYSVKTAARTAFDLLRKPSIKDAIKETLNASAVTAEETVKIISDIARGNLGDYFVKTKVRKSELVKKPLSAVIAEFKLQMQFETELAGKLELKPRERTNFLKNLAAMRVQLTRLELELKHNPKAYRIENGPEQLVETVELDIARVIQDKERGRIKSITPTEHGLKVELYAADNAAMLIAKMHGLFEKDNQQRKADVGAIVFIGDEEISRE